MNEPDAAGGSVIVVFGAAVTADGRPSGALLRRIKGARVHAERIPNSVLLLTGGIGDYGDAEAEVMKRCLIKAGVEESRLICDTQAHNTISSIINCRRILQKNSGIRRVFICTDRYHTLRCMLLFAILSVRATTLTIDSGRTANGTIKWCWYYVREFIALFVDTPLLFLRRIVGAI